MPIDAAIDRLVAEWLSDPVIVRDALVDGLRNEDGLMAVCVLVSRYQNDSSMPVASQLASVFFNCLVSKFEREAAREIGQ